MSVQKALVIFLAVVLAATAYQFITSRPPSEPSNDCVHEFAFDRLRAGMTEAEVEGILGQPHKTISGQVVRVERLESPTMSWAIEEQRDDANGNVLKVYCGRNEESIAVLFLTETRKVTAAEYRVSDCPVIYVGPSAFTRSKTIAAASMPRLVLSDEVQKQEQNLSRYQRRNALGESRAGSSFASMGATAALPLSPPMPASAALPPSGLPSSQGSRLRPAPRTLRLHRRLHRPSRPWNRCQ